MKYAIEMDSRVFIYIPSFITIHLTIQKFIKEKHRNTDLISLNLFKNNEIG
jgi:hypothetical protein